MDEIKDLQKGITEVLVAIGKIETEIKQLSSMAGKWEQTEKLAIEALQSTKAAHKRIDELSKQLSELEKKIEEDKKQNKDDKKWMIGTAVVVLLVLGYFLKRTPRIQDWMIQWFLTVAGVVLACGILQAITVESVVQGILAAGIASLTHQIWKQTPEKRKDDAE